MDLAGENRLLRLIIEVTSADLDVREISQRVAGLVTAATGSDVCFVHLLDEDGERVVLAGATPPFDELVGTVELALGEGIAGWVAQHARPTVVPDKWQDRRYRYIPALRGEDYVSMASVPMLTRSRGVIGVLNVHSRMPRQYGDSHVALLSQVANLMAGTIENARLYERLAEREEALEGFASRVIEAQEHERRRLAGEIHDGISQRLISLWYHLLAAEDATADPATLRRELAVAKDLATDALADARGAITGLRPSVLDDLGLAPSLESLARSLPVPDVQVDLAVVELAPHVEAALYRIAQEALQNVVKHAKAESVVMSLVVSDGEVRLAVRDDGRGFDEQSPEDRDRHAYGMAGIRERAELIGARLSVTSRRGIGTTLEVVVPMPPSSGQTPADSMSRL
ncbi:MAG: GAF domain-containing sensor histidine kinase [Acidimicrobiales bacterium]